MQKWQIGTTLPMQLFLESFLNQQTLSKTDFVLKHLQNKVPKLYTHFDGLMSVHNKEYSGLLQDLNTKERAKKSHSITLLFTIVSKTVAIQTLRTPETFLTQEEDTWFVLLQYISEEISHEVHMHGWWNLSRDPYEGLSDHNWPGQLCEADFSPWCHARS